MDYELGSPNRSNAGLQPLHNLRQVHWNLPTPILVEHIVKRGEGLLSDHGAVVVNTGQHTGRSPNDKFITRFTEHDDNLIWWGKVNCPFPSERFENLYKKVIAYFQGRDVYVQDLSVGAHPNYQLPIRVITETAWHSLFSRDLFIRKTGAGIRDEEPQFTLLHAPNFKAVPAEDGTRSDVFIVVNFPKKLILVGGTSYAGEVKKSIFTIMNYLLPLQGVLSMHCSANVGHDGNVALFFGLSGTGKTTLSSDLERRLIGDDEHGWGEEGVFNFEGGCYAKTIHLRRDLEPLIWEAIRRFGTVLENVRLDTVSRSLDFDDSSLTENTRAAYPIDFVPNHVPEGYAGHPENIFFLTADASGVLPPLARLSPDQAMYYFLSGYTSKLAGTEKGLSAEPQATFSTCFGAPFLPLHPMRYARLLGEKIQKQRTKVWLINTGWTGGPYGIGSRIKLPYTRAMVRAALTHQLDPIPTRIDPYFGLAVPLECPEVPSEVLDPRSTWSDQAAYDRQARLLISQFDTNFEQFNQDVSAEIIQAGPGIQDLAV